MSKQSCGADLPAGVSHRQQIRIGQARDGAVNVDLRCDAYHRGGAADLDDPHSLVLVVDDDANILHAAVLRLRAAGYDTIAAGDGDEVIGSVLLHWPKAIVLDVRMPRCDGMRVLAELQLAPLSRNIPVIMLSASLGDRQRALQSGARFFLQKPYSGAMLVEAVRRAISESLDHDTLPSPGRE